MLHATQTSERLLQHPMTGFPLQLSQKAHTAGVLFTSHSLGRSTIAVGPGNGAKQV